MLLISSGPVSGAETGRVTDRSITAKSLLIQIQKRYKINTDGATELLRKFWRGLGHSISEGELKTLLRQVPKELAALFMETH